MNFENSIPDPKKLTPKRIMKTVIISTLKCTEFGYPSHPESPQRIKLSYNYLVKINQFLFVEPQDVCNETDVLKVHTKKLLNQVKTGNFSEPDTPSLPDIYKYAILSASASIIAMQECLDNTKVTFSLMRPPGHHASRDSLGGFCYFNNIAIAVKIFLQQNNTISQRKKVAIIDIDCHHGNGTQDIFLNDQNVLFISLHQIPLYPGTGLRSENNCLNFHLPPGTEETKYLNTLETALNNVVQFNPDIIGVSSGFDTYRLDPLTQMSLAKTTYTKIGKMISSLKLPRFAVLEGGYSKDLPECIFNFLTGFSEE